MYMHKALMRIALCAFIGVLIISQSASLLHNDNVVDQILAIPILAMGLLIVIFGFSPSLGKRIIKAIVDIVKIVFRAS